MRVDQGWEASTKIKGGTFYVGVFPDLEDAKFRAAQDDQQRWRAPFAQNDRVVSKTTGEHGTVVEAFPEYVGIRWDGGTVEAHSETDDLRLEEGPQRIEERPGAGTCQPFTRLERDPELYARCRARARGPLTNARSIYDLCSPDLEKLDTERFMVLGLDMNGNLRSYTQVGQGQKHRVAVDVDEVVQVLSVDRPDGYVLIHQHPSGDPHPSDADRDLTKTIRTRTDKQFDKVQFVDHVIVGHRSFYSFQEGKVTKV